MQSLAGLFQRNIRGGSFLSPDTRSECFLRGVKFLSENLRGMKFSRKIIRGLKISPFQEEQGVQKFKGYEIISGNH